MRLFLVILLSITCTLSVHGQEFETTPSNRLYSGYGGPFIKASSFAQGWGVAVGGQGGVLVGRHFAFGGSGWGLVNSVGFEGADLDNNFGVPLNLRAGAGGVFVEGIYSTRGRLHVTLPIHLNFGGISVTDPGEGTIESSSVWFLEPGIGIEMELGGGVIPGLHLSYRIASGVNTVNVTNEDLSGISLGLFVKFGG